MTVVKSVSDGLRDSESETHLNLDQPLRISAGPRHLSRPLSTGGNTSFLDDSLLLSEVSEDSRGGCCRNGCDNGRVFVVYRYANRQTENNQIRRT